MRLLLIRSIIAAVTIINLQCAVVFIFYPGRYSTAFELSGVTGEAAVRGFGILFLMWTVPYWVALWNPIRHSIALLEASVMQMIGLVGEFFILQSIPIMHAITRSSLTRFIIFDAVGLAGLLVAIYLTYEIKKFASLARQ